MNPYTHAVVGMERDTGRVYLVRLGHKKIQRKSVTPVGKDRVKFQFEAGTIDEAIGLAQEKLKTWLDEFNRTVEIHIQLVKI
jgi:hypothetical protein